MSFKASSWGGGGGIKRKTWKCVSKIISGFRKQIDKTMLQVDAGKLLVQRDLSHVMLAPFQKLSCQPSSGDHPEDNSTYMASST